MLYYSECSFTHAYYSVWRANVEMLSTGKQKAR